MERQRVTSKNLCSVGYDEETSTLEISFNSGFVYQYFGVPFHLFNGLMFAGSKGEFFDRFIRKARYKLPAGVVEGGHKPVWLKKTTRHEL